MASRSVGSACAGKGGYSDIQNGTDVTVRDEENKIIGTSDLQGGKVGSSPRFCTWAIVVPNHRSKT